ncbi:hypothetical protein LA080_014144 [Diaporthe eres]|uniref:F-box domain-containing protein n=1 Tax=Diaporthe vaccinii TaxID=105482 RepID=A0ABR4E7Q4_9PEZI|nr:hypothetical protein LA080_014144 [Diaporthe eres]
MEIIEHSQTNSTEPASTNPLLSLPPELLLPIFSFIGGKNFRQDVRRLAVCKMWYAYARPVLWNSLSLRMTWRLLPVVRAMGTGTLAAAQKLTKHIDLTLRRTSSRLDPQDLAHSPIEDLEELASELKDFAALRTLVIRPEGHGWLYSIMPIRIFSSFASLHQLTSLEMDLADMVFDPSPRPHLCESLSQLIPNLKRLRCRLPRICLDLLGSPPGDLEELIVNISPRKYARLYSRGCSEDISHDFDYARLRARMETGLLQFAGSMHDPKIVRLIHRLRYRGRNRYAFDAIQNRRLFLGTSTAWDADGVLLPEDWDEGREGAEESEESGDSLSDDEELADGESHE